MLHSNRQNTYCEIAMPHDACQYRWQSKLQQLKHLPRFTPLKLNTVVGSSAPAVAAVAMGTAAVAALVSTLPFPGLLLAALLIPAVALPLPLPSSVVDVAPPNVVVEAAAPAKAEKLPEEGPHEKAPNAGGSAACLGGVGCAAGTGDGAPPLPAQQHLW